MEGFAWRIIHICLIAEIVFSAMQSGNRIHTAGGRIPPPVFYRPVTARRGAPGMDSNEAVPV